MRSLIITIVAVAVFGLLALTNPKMPDYEQYIHTQILRKGEQSDEVSKGVAHLFGGIESRLIANATKRTDYIFFSIYETTSADEEIRYLGVLNNFVSIGPSKPEGK